MTLDDLELENKLIFHF